MCFVSHTLLTHTYTAINILCTYVCVRMTCETCIAVTFSRSFRRVVATGSSSVKERAGRQKSELSASLSCSQTSSHICIGVCVCVYACTNVRVFMYACMYVCTYNCLNIHCMWVLFIYVPTCPLYLKCTQCGGFSRGSRFLVRP